MAAQARIMNDGEALPALVSKAKDRRLGGLNYAGEVTPEEVLTQLQQEGGVLADVRSIPEWQAGLADVAGTKGELVTLSWKIAPNMVLNTDFPAQFDALGISKDTPIFFMCRGGGRSLDAAVTMTAAGYQYCFNVTGGFEGSRDHAGWKASNLPCKQG